MTEKADLDFADALAKYVAQAPYSARQLADACGLPQRTFANWLEGRVRKPRDWRSVARVASVLHLSEAEATELLQSAGFPTVEELVLDLTESRDSEALSELKRWTEAVERRLMGAPFLAIRDLPYFVGREQQLEDLKGALLKGERVAICSLHGMGGIGKTVLAAHLAYQLRPHFPDGVLWARVDTSDPKLVLSSFAEVYGRNIDDLPSLEGKSRVVREILANKRALMILDSATTSQQVEPLLPPTTVKCAVVITTRRTDLSVALGAHRLLVGPFDKEKQEALTLFEMVLGQDRIESERALFRRIADALGHHPLAIAIVAGRLSSEPHWTAAGFLERISDEARRLDELQYEDLSVRVSFAISYDILSEHLQRFFIALGSFGGDDFGVEAAAFVYGVPDEQAQVCLRELFRLSLVQEGRPDRYRLHLLLRDYAREQEIRRDQLERMVDYYVAFAGTHQQEFEVLDIERTNILHALRTATQEGMANRLIAGLLAVYDFFIARGLYEETAFLLEQAYQADEASQDPTVRVRLLLHLGTVSVHLGKHKAGEEYLRNGLAAARKIDDLQRIGEFLTRLGMQAEVQGNYAEAEAFHLEALAHARSLGDDAQICPALQNLAVMELNVGKLHQANEHLQEGLEAAKRTGDPWRIGSVLQALGAVAYYLGDYEGARKCWEQGAEIARTIQHQELLSGMLTNLGELANYVGDFEYAQGWFQEALDIAQKIGHPGNTIYVLDGLGKLELERGNFLEAEQYLTEGLELARAINQRELMCSLLGGLGTLARRLDNPTQAEGYWQEGLEIAHEIGHRLYRCAIIYEWGELFLDAEDVESAARSFSDAMKEARETDNLVVVGKALFGLARVDATQEHHDQALDHGRQSLDMLEKAGHHFQHKVRQWLAQLKPPVASRR